MEHTTTAAYEQGLSFDVELDNHHFKIDGDEEYGGKDKGPKPKKLLLAALAGCTGMDVVSILHKMKMPFDSFWLEIKAELDEQARPSVYTSFVISYCFRGDRLERDKIEKAVELSDNKYCSVSAMFRTFAVITSEIKLNPPQ
jgi:putative redox protein